MRPPGRPGAWPWETSSLWAYFSDDLLRGIDTEHRNRRESLHGILMHAEQPRELLVELLHVRLNDLQFGVMRCARRRDGSAAAVPPPDRDDPRNSLITQDLTVYGAAQICTIRCPSGDSKRLKSFQ
jgi:hypothetical protein